MTGNVLHPEIEERLTRMPWPPTGNRFRQPVRRGNRGASLVVTKEARAYYAAIFALVRDGTPGHALETLPVTTPVAVSIDLFRPDLRKRDLDNVLKCLLDSLVHSGVLADDSQVQRITLQFAGLERPNGRAHLTIRAYHPQLLRSAPQGRPRKSERERKHP